MNRGLGIVRRRETVIGGREPIEPDELQVIEARIRYARSNPSWHEVPEGLVRRGPGGRYLIDPESDAVYSIRSGEVFSRGRAVPDFVDPKTELWFFVSERGPVFLGRPFGARSWSEIFGQRARSAARAAS